MLVDRCLAIQRSAFGSCCPFSKCYGFQKGRTAALWLLYKCIGSYCAAL